MEQGVSSTQTICVSQPSTSPQRLYGVRTGEQESEKSHIDVGLPTEDLAKGHNSPWLTWRSLNRLRTGYTYSKEQQKKWKYYDGDTTCVCGLATENTAHLLQCSLLTRPCTLDDLLEFNDRGRECAERWKKTV